MTKEEGSSEKKPLFKQCAKYGLSLWQCPQFLFLVMGLLICVTAVFSYLVGTHYIADPGLVALMVLFLSGLLFVVDVMIVRSFERIAEANRMKSEFITVVSHQLRSPLSNFRWALGALKSGNLGEVREKQVEYLNILEENTDRMFELVSDLLMVSRIQAANLPLQSTSFSLEERVREMIEEFKPFAQASNIRIELRTEEIPPVLGDPERIDLVVENLLDNAIRYTRGGGKVEIRLEKERGKVKCEVADEGVGIPEEEQEHIFEKFFRAENAAKQKADGSGLGLFIAKSILERSGGEIGFQSEEGKGSTFWFRLPIAK